MNWVRKLILLGFILKSATGCAAVDAVGVAYVVEDFAKGVLLLSQVVKNGFAMAEKANSNAFRNNLKLQLETGGNFDVTQEPLYSSADLAARAVLLNSLTQYAQSLASIALKDDPATYLTHSSVEGNLLGMTDYEQLDLSHSIDRPGVQSLYEGLEFFRWFFSLPEREAKLAAIVSSGRVAFEKTAKLLYIDLGEKADQSKACNHAPPIANPLHKIHSLILCRGGLRGLLGSVIKRELATWKKRLLLTKTSEAATLTTNRRRLINRLISAQQNGQQVDQVISQTQAVLKKMISSHNQIVQMLKHPDIDEGSFNFFAPRTFLAEVTVLAEKVNRIDRSLDSFSGQSTAAISFSDSSISKSAK
ncbi:hypothetical protein NBZ79_01380 [Sneathiella marina]|uniref:Imelysin-like domain-containing protein n=1 Tax=Sneathiella marina TaxID=2950108 RepID=A0ABY4W681_9PROT|nr:hypothetical protein [Sneathiella marina]USG61628.1 hypothetical protein NBZ79_01380 [Sneathiella marina]